MRANPAQSELDPVIAAARWRMIMGRICDDLLHALWIWLIAMPLLAWLMPDHAMIAGAAIAIPLALFTTRLRVTRQQAACELDQLNSTQDLISTALATAATEPWGRTIHAMATRACSGAVMPSATGKYAPRLHLATLLLAVSGAFAIFTWPQTPASAYTEVKIRELRAGELSESIETLERPRSSQSDSREFANKEPITGNRGGDQRSQSGADARGEGHSGEGVQTRIIDHSMGVDSQSNGTVTVSGSGPPGTALFGEQTSGTVQDPAKHPAITPWQSPDWPARRAAALDAARERDLPESDRALIREYFDR